MSELEKNLYSATGVILHMKMDAAEGELTEEEVNKCNSEVGEYWGAYKV